MNWLQTYECVVEISVCCSKHKYVNEAQGGFTRVECRVDPRSTVCLKLNYFTNAHSGEREITNWCSERQVFWLFLYSDGEFFYCLVLRRGIVWLSGESPAIDWTWRTQVHSANGAGTALLPSTRGSASGFETRKLAVGRRWQHQDHRLRILQPQERQRRTVQHLCRIARVMSLCDWYFC